MKSFLKKWIKGIWRDFETLWKTSNLWTTRHRGTPSQWCRSSYRIKEKTSPSQRAHWCDPVLEGPWQWVGLNNSRQERQMCQVEKAYVGSFIKRKGGREGREKERRERKVKTCLPLQKNGRKERVGMGRAYLLKDLLHLHRDQCCSSQMTLNWPGYSLSVSC